MVDNSSGYKLRKKWADGKTSKVEDKLTDFLVGAIKVADRKINERIEAKERERRWEEERKRCEEERRCRYIEEKRLEELLNQLNSWTKSQQLRNYIQAVQAAAIKLPNLEDFQDKLEEWVSWAEQHADLLDPLTQQLPFEFDQESEDSETRY